jgi:hypothetical protein
MCYKATFLEASRSRRLPTCPGSHKTTLSPTRLPCLLVPPAAHEVETPCTTTSRVDGHDSRLFLCSLIAGCPVALRFEPEFKCPAFPIPVSRSTHWRGSHARYTQAISGSGNGYKTMSAKEQVRARSKRGSRRSGRVTSTVDRAWSCELEIDQRLRHDTNTFHSKC